MWISRVRSSRRNSVKLLLGGLLIGLFTICVNAQTTQEWTNQKQLQTAYIINQIAALNAYLEVAKKGYRIASVGLKAIGDIQQGELSLHGNYFSSLSAVHPVVLKYPQVDHILIIHGQIHKEVAWMDVYLREENKLKSTEKLTASRLNEATLNSSMQILSQLEAILRPNSYGMEDGERLAALDELHSAIVSLYGALQDHSKHIRFLNWSRIRNEMSNSQFNKLYDIK